MSTDVQSTYQSVAGLFLVQPNIITIEWPCHSQMLYGYAVKNVPFKTALYIGSLADDST